MRSKPPRWAIRNCAEPEDDTDTIAASALRDKLAGCVARFADRRDDWSVFGFETALDPKFARAQRRYLGASGSVDHNDLRGWIPATAFTMSIQSMPPGNRIPMHCRHETKEISFILDGKARVRCWEYDSRGILCGNPSPPRSRRQKSRSWCSPTKS
jgi:hypothetical protein